MDDLRRKLDKIEDRLDSIDKHLAVYNQQLVDHIRRTELLEDQINPIRANMDQLKGAGKLIAVLALIATITGGIVVFFK